MQSLEQIIINSWKDDKIYKRFKQAFKKKFKADLDIIDWPGKIKDAPHPSFQSWLSNGKI